MDCLEQTAQSVLFSRWNNLISCRDACLLHDDVDAVHDLRVSTRRLRSALKLFIPLCPNAPSARLYKAVRRLTREVGIVRDLDEALLFFEQERRLCDAKERFEDLLRTLNKHRRKESIQLKFLLQAFSVDMYEADIAALARQLPDNGSRIVHGRQHYSLSGYLSACSLRLFKKVLRQLQGTLIPEADDERHALRIAIKRWRYFIEVVADLTGLDYSLYLSTLKAYQSMLGRLNDLVVFTVLADKQGLKGDERACFVASVTEKHAQYLRSFCRMVEQNKLTYEFHI